MTDRELRFKEARAIAIVWFIAGAAVANRAWMVATR